MKPGAQRRETTMARAKQEMEAAARGETLEPLKKPAPRRHDEANHAKAFIRWRDMVVKSSPESPLQWLHSSLNGAHLTPTQAHVMKAEGMTAGIWDYFLPQYRTGRSQYSLPFWGLYIEMKAPGRENTKNGGLSEEQVKFGRFVKNQSYCVVVAYGWEQAREAVEAYLSKIGGSVPHQWVPKHEN